MLCRGSRERNYPNTKAPDTSEGTCSSKDAFPGKQLTLVILTLSDIYLLHVLSFQWRTQEISNGMKGVASLQWLLEPDKELLNLLRKYTKLSPKWESGASWDMAKMNIKISHLYSDMDSLSLTPLSCLLLTWEKKNMLMIAPDCILPQKWGDSIL